MTVLKENKDETPKENPDPEIETQKSQVTVHVKFETNSDKVTIKSKATGEKTTVVAANKKLRLISGRLYYVPVDSDANSDLYGSIKEFSSGSDKFSIRYVKDGIACIDPIQHHAMMEDMQQLCILW